MRSSAVCCGLYSPLIGLLADAVLVYRVIDTLVPVVHATNVRTLFILIMYFMSCLTLADLLMTSIYHDLDQSGMHSVFDQPHQCECKGCRVVTRIT